MAKLNELLKTIKKTFTLHKKVDFEELKISIVLETLTSMEELKILEACKDFEGGAYIEAIKKSSLAYSIKQINDVIFNDPDIIYEDDEGKSIKESKYLFLLRQIEDWPAAVRDVLFDAFNEMHRQLEALVSSKVKFERFTVQPPPVVEETKKEAEVPEGFHKLEKEKDEEETEVDRLNKKVSEEQAQAQVDLDKKRNE